MTTLDYHSNKEVSFRFNGENLSFFLSQSLFSSYDVDEGSKLLLKTLVQKHTVPPDGSILDAGCGTGVLGLSLKKSFPGTSVTLQDRDALAVYFTQINAEKNGISGVEVRTALAFTKLSGEPYDLIVANLPAKAGTPVLKHFLSEILRHLSQQGTGAVVVVSPLREITETALQELHADIHYREDTGSYTVFHFMRGEQSGSSPEGGGEPLAPYIRHTDSYTAGSTTYSLTTVFGLPGFDTLPYEAVLTASLPSRYTPSGDILIWNPGQGHYPAILLSSFPGSIKHLTLVSRDILQCEISAYNSRALSKTLTLETQYHPSLLTALHGKHQGKKSCSWIVAYLSEPAEKKMLPAIIAEAQTVLSTGGILVCAGKSSLLSPLSKGHPGYIPVFSRKYRGFRIVMLQKRE